MSASPSRVEPPLRHIGELLDDLAASPTPYHAAQRVADQLVAAGFAEVGLGEGWPANSGPLLVRRGGLLIAWVPPEGAAASMEGFTVIGAHTDSPNLRLRPKPAREAVGFRQVGVEVYGGVLLNSWLDRDLGVAGRLSVLDASGQIEQVLVKIDQPLLRVPQLAIHLDREISTNGLKLNPQLHLSPVWGLSPVVSDPSGSASDGSGGDDANESDEASLLGVVADQVGIAQERILAHDLMAYDLQAPTTVGMDEAMFASARIDNLVSTFCASRALAALSEGGPGELRRCPVLVLYDHEEVGSTTNSGADGSVLGSVLERIALSAGLDRGEYLSALARSVAISADGAHATHPNYADRHDPDHQIFLNRGIVVKANANMRYASDALSGGFAQAVADEAGLDVQFYSHRNDLPCGSTIGPMLSAQLGIPTVDIGAAQLGMHSIREMAGCRDALDLSSFALTAWRSSIGLDC